MIADYDVASAARAAAIDERFSSAQVDASTPTQSPRSPASTALTHVMNAVDPLFVMPIFEGALRRRRRLPRHGDVAVPSAPGRAVRAVRA